MQTWNAASAAASHITMRPRVLPVALNVTCTPLCFRKWSPDLNGQLRNGPMWVFKWTPVARRWMSAFRPLRPFRSLRRAGSLCLGRLPFNCSACA